MTQDLGLDPVRPFHSMLNYVLGLAIVRLRIATIGLELDSDVGIYHEDDEYRESLLYDLVEPLRARIERLLIEQCLAGLKVGWFTYVAQTGRGSSPEVGVNFPSLASALFN
ncbi:MAG: CRISPR-associated endonuclease Cas1 [Firmicutes bacterium]|nr:CRISPR-associated endonuclease Cas1 [Bacillota bacterium]